MFSTNFEPKFDGKRNKENTIWSKELASVRYFLLSVFF
ncbi:hypothetical protein FCR2A7T_08090 [Flavobacterium cauense R2A-7]|nr:hypothetical protein FCR2A7T_08090 [Flavobacterium cauense R2A-7]